MAETFLTLSSNIFQIDFPFKSSDMQRSTELVPNKFQFINL